MAQNNYGLIREGTGNAILKPIPIPHLRDDYILVKAVAIALNPTDWTTLDAKGDDGTIVGCDFAGIVEEVGKDVKKQFKKGDRVNGFAHGGNDAYYEDGAFARYITAKGDLQMHIPDHVSFEEACTIGGGIGTACYGLFNVLQLPSPENKSVKSDKPILIYGGSTATGTLAIQLAKLVGRKVITTCSPRNFDLVKDRGADLVFDYRDPNVGEAIRKVTDDDLDEIFDCVAIEDSAKICSIAMGKNGGVYCNLLGIDCPRDDIKSIFFLGYDAIGKAYVFEGDHYPARPDVLEFATKYMTIAEKIWAEGKLKAHPQRIGSGGLLGAIDGMKQMKEGKYSGEKLVYRVDDTVWP